MGMTSCSGATSTMRLPVVGNWSVQSPRGGVSLVRWTTLTMRMPLAGAVPAVAAFSATETALNEPFAGVIAAVIPGAIGAAAVWTKYSDACGNPCVCQAMSASSSLKPSSGAKPVTKFPLTFPSAKYAQIKLPPFASLSAGVKTPLVRWGAIDPAALLVPLSAATVAMPVSSETVYWKFLTGASKVMVIVSTQAPPAQAFGSTKIDEINWPPSSAVTTGGPQVCALTSVTETVRVFDHSYEIPITRQLPGSTGFGSVNLKALPNSLMLTGLAELETCWTSAGAAGPEGGLTRMLVPRLSLRPRAVAVTVIAQVPSAAAVQVVAAEAVEENVPHPAGAAVHLNAMGSLSASIAVAVNETWSPRVTAV